MLNLRDELHGTYLLRFPTTIPPLHVSNGWSARSIMCADAFLRARSRVCRIAHRAPCPCCAEPAHRQDVTLHHVQTGLSLRPTRVPVPKLAPAPRLPAVSVKCSANGNGTAHWMNGNGVRKSLRFLLCTSLPRGLHASSVHSTAGHTLELTTCIVAIPALAHTLCVMLMYPEMIQGRWFRELPVRS